MKMKKTTLKILLPLLFFSFYNYGQISVSAKHYGKARKFKKGVLERFKQTETIFVLPQLYDTSEYEKILEKSWDVTPFKVVSYYDFNFEDYLDDRYSIAQIEGYLEYSEKSGKMSTPVLNTHFDIKMFQSEELLERWRILLPEFKKADPKYRDIWQTSVINEYSINICRFYLHAKDVFVDMPEDEDLDVVDKIYNEDIFYNTKLGYLQNYFQKINDLLKEEKIYWMYDNDYLPALTNLKKDILYIPSHSTFKFDSKTFKDSQEKNKNNEEIFKEYEYKYKIIPDEELNEKILNNEDFYYLRYVRMGKERFIQIVHSKTGEIIYRDYIPGLLYHNIKKRHIKTLNSTINKASN